MSITYKDNLFYALGIFSG